MIKIMKYQIVKPIDTSWKVLGGILNDLQKETRDMRNKTSQLCWEWNGFNSDYKEEHGEYPKQKDIMGYTNMHGYSYNKLKGVHNKGNSGNRSTSIKDVADKWKNDLKEILRGDRLPPSYKKNVPIDLAKQSISIIHEDGEYYADLSMLSNPYKKELGLKSGKLLLMINARDKSQKVILDRIISGEYSVSASQIKMIRKGRTKWMLHLAYEFEPVEEDLDEGMIMGVDMGIVYPLYMAFNSGLSRYKVNGGEIEHFRRQVENRKNSMLEQGKYCGEGRRGHGVKTRIKPIEKMRKKVSNFRDTANHKYSRYVIDMALKHKCKTIQMEDLTGINKNNVFLKNWSYFDLQQKIKYKAEEVGINVIMIDPKYTSQRCNKCGHIDRDNRPNQKTFKCTKCGLTTNADFNAAKNIATEGIETIIKDTKEELVKKAS